MKPLSVTSRVIILITAAIIFGAAMIALSLHTKSDFEYKTNTSDEDKKIERTFAVTPGGVLYLNADIGNISISTSDSEAVLITVYMHGTEDDLRRFNVNFDQDGNSIRIKMRQKQPRFRFFEINSADILFDVKVPKEFNLELQTAGGNIGINGVRGKIKGETSGGNIELSDIESNLRMSTSGGNVSIKNSSGDFKLETSGGNMYCKDVVGRIFMETSGGNIDIKDVDGNLHASTSGGNIYARLKSNKGIDLSTSGGNITVDLPRSVSANVKAEASGGDVSCELEFSGKIKDGRMNGKINGGGEMIRLETSGGDIIISPID